MNRRSFGNQAGGLLAASQLADKAGAGAAAQMQQYAAASKVQLRPAVPSGSQHLSAMLAPEHEDARQAALCARKRLVLA